MKVRGGATARGVGIGATRAALDDGTLAIHPGSIGLLVPGAAVPLTPCLACGALEQRIVLPPA